MPGQGQPADRGPAPQTFQQMLKMHCAFCPFEAPTVALQDTRGVTDLEDTEDGEKL